MGTIQKEDQTLIQAAHEVRQRAYAPYSGYRVGAALRTKGGKVFTGVNVENASYPLSICAERTAVFKAVSEGEMSFDTVVVATENGGTPCGACRQVLSEFGLDIRVLIINQERDIVLETTVGELLPGAFGGKDLE